MKHFILLIGLALSLNLSAQDEDYSGNYILYAQTDSGDIIYYKLNLESDSTFVFKSNRTGIRKGFNQVYGKGKWLVVDQVIHFTTEASDLDEDYTLNFSGTTARIIKKFPKDKLNKVVLTTLQFYKSELLWISNLKLILTDE